MVDPVLGIHGVELLEVFVDPKKRLFWGYLCAAMLLALLWLVWTKNIGIVDSLKTVFSKKIWWSRSSRWDYQVFFLNRVLMLFISPLLLTQVAVATWAFYCLHDLMPSRPLFFSDWSDIAIGALFTVGYFLLDDFARFYTHRLLHQWPVLWAFHKVHHSAETLTPLTVFRAHPVELIIFSVRSILVQALSIAVAVFFMGDRVDIITVLGANIVIVAFNVSGSNLRHSHIAMAYWKPLEKWLMSPAQHHIHHSTAPAHKDKNYGVVLSLWDRLWGSLHHSETHTALTFGLCESPGRPHPHNLRDTYFTPVVESFRIGKRFFFVDRVLTHGKSKHTGMVISFTPLVDRLGALIRSCCGPRATGQRVFRPKGSPD